MLGALLALGYAALFLLIIRKAPYFRAEGLPARTIGALFLVKLLAGTALWYVYTYIHTDRATADIYRYFDDGNIMYGALAEHPLDYLRMLTGIRNDEIRFDEGYYQIMHNWYRQFESNMYNDAHTMIRFNAFVRLFSFGHYHVHTVFACFFCTIGLVALHKAFAARIPGLLKPWAWALFLLPSVLFWSSGVIKESLLFFGLGLFVLSLKSIVLDRARWWHWGMVPFCLVLLFFLKFYVLLSMIPALVAYLWCRRSGDTRPLLKFAIVYGCFILVGLNADLFYPKFNILEVLWVKQRDFIGLAVDVKAGSLIAGVPLEPHIWSFVRNTPRALFMSFLSPFVTLGNGPLGLMSAVENLFLMALLVFAIIRRKPWKNVDHTLLYFCVGFCLLLALVIGWTTPVVGALVRYRAPFLPFFVLACLCLMDAERLRWFKRMTKPEES